MVAIQFVGSSVLAALLCMLALVARGALAAWWRLFCRMRWLLASGWLIMAYAVPGDAWFDLAWAPTEQGMHEATLQSLRLVFTLGCLAWLFRELDRDALLVALLGLLPGSATPGTERFAVRLWLVMANLQDERFRGAWRRILDDVESESGNSSTLSLSLPAWSRADLLFCGAVTALCIVTVWFG
jgi:hypothetical protein